MAIDSLRNDDSSNNASLTPKHNFQFYLNLMTAAFIAEKNIITCIRIQMLL